MTGFSRVCLARGVACGVLLIVAGTVCRPAWSAADTPPPPPPGTAAMEDGPEDGPDGPPMADKQIIDFQLWRMTQDLQLSDADAARVFPRMRKLGEAQSQLRRDRMKLMKDLRSSLKKGSPEDLQSLVARIRETEVARQQAVMSLEDSVLSSLTARQQAQYLVSREQFMRDLHRMAEEARTRRFEGDDGMKGPDGMRPPRMGGPGGRPGGGPGGGFPGGGGGPRGHR